LSAAAFDLDLDFDFDSDKKSAQSEAWTEHHQVKILQGLKV
jgi:hypothetical protein